MNNKNNLALLMAQKKKKISDVSKDTGISRTTLTNIYYERNKSITFEVLEKLCNYFECSVDEFIPRR